MKKSYFLLSCLAVVLGFTSHIATAQLTITPSATAAQLAAKLTGPGVLVLNPVLTCPTNAEGTFTGTSSLSFDSGIVLTTGQAATSGTTYGAGGPASNFASTNNAAPGDPALDALSGATTYDACVLEFDFRPAGDTIKFNYVFGSEEYNGFTCTAFNDVFGFFISGPGYPAPVNIALVPGTNIPVCINSVNCGPGTGTGTMSTCTALGPGAPFCAYYVNNLAGTTITYDGITTTLTAIAAVTPCDTFQLKIGIADATDGIWDSGVFIEARSLTSVGISLTPVSSDPADTSFGGPFCVRGCNPGQFVFNLSGTSPTTQTIHYAIGGTAVNGHDYTTIPDSVNILPGSTTASITINGLPVMPATGPQTVTLYIYSNVNCGGVTTIIDSATITIYDSFYVHINTPDTAICLGQSLTINATGDPFLQYHWTPISTPGNDTLLTPFETPTTTTTYTITGSYPGLGCPPVAAQITVTVTALYVQIRDTTFCIGQPAVIGLTVNPASPGSTYLWSPSANLNDPTLMTPTFSTNTVGDYPLNVTVTNSIGCMGADAGVVHVMPPAIISVTPGNSVINYSGHIQLNAINMTPYPLVYWWLPDNGSLTNNNINNPIASPIDSTAYVVYAMNEWGCRDSATVTIQVMTHGDVVIPSAFTPNGDGRNDEFRVLNLSYRKLVSFEVYDRWGAMVYKNDNDPKHGWDGTYKGVLQDIGTYSYIIVTANPDGSDETFKGNVTLLR